MISGQSHTSLPGAPAATANDLNAVNNSQNAPAAISAVIANATMCVARARHRPVHRHAVHGGEQCERW